MKKDLDYYNSLPKPEYSTNHRKQINKIFKEIIGSSEIPYPEVEELCDKRKSDIVKEIEVKIEDA